MTAATVPIPDPSRHDVEEVQCALAVSAARWEHGDYEDSLRWLRRAARAAADHELLERALELSKAAARMSKGLSQAPPPPRRSGVAPKPLLLERRLPPARPLPARRPPRPTRPEVRRPGSFADDDEATESRALRLAPPPAPDESRPVRSAAPQPVWEMPSLLADADEDEPTNVRARPLPSAPLSASRVAVMRDPQTQRPTLVVLPPHVPAPPGSAVAMLVGSSAEDTLRLQEILQHAVLEPS